MGGVLCCCGPGSPGVVDETAVAVAGARSHTSRGRLLVFVNPHSGPGRGVKTFRNKVEPLLKANRLDYELVITTGPLHAHSLVRERPDLPEFNAVIILSGDGLVFEVLNGLRLRADSEWLLPALPVGIIPSGSGNGLLSSVMHQHGLSLSKHFVRDAIGVATSPMARAHPVNLVEVQTLTAGLTTKCISFLSIGWGLMADIDIESERWRRALGSQRFTLQGLIRSFKLRSYRARLEFLPYTDRKRQRTDTFRVYEANARTRGEKVHSVDSWKEKQGKEEEEESGERHNSAFEDDGEGEREERTRLPSRIPCVAEDATPEGWTVIEDEFVAFYVVVSSHISNTGPYMLPAKLCDDRMYLTYILKKDIRSKLQVVKFLTEIESGKHLDLDFFHTVEVSAMRLTPITEGSRLTVDGEVIPGERIQAAVTPLRSAILCSES